jgi:hypothetical protein
MSNEKSVPVRRVTLGGTGKEEKEESPSSATTSNVATEPTRNTDSERKRKAEILAKAREAKKLKNQQKNVTEPSVTTGPFVPLDSSVDNNDSDDDVDIDEPITVPSDVPLSSRKRKALTEAVYRGSQQEDDPEENPRKKSKTSTENPSDTSLRNFLLDKTIDIGRLAAASGIASIGLVILRGMTSGNPSGNTSQEWIKQ